jgi:hypothetical protein
MFWSAEHRLSWRTFAGHFIGRSAGEGFDKARHLVDSGAVAEVLALVARCRGWVEVSYVTSEQPSATARR